MASQGTWLFRFRGQIPIVLFVLAIPVVLTEPGAPQLWVIWLSIGLSFMGALMRAYVVGTTPRGTSGRNTKEQVAEVLNSTGAYSIVRHPLYFANYLMWIGIVAFTGNLWFVTVVSLLYWIYYERIMVTEEAFLISKFGDAYHNWAKNTPAFFPRLFGFKSSSEPFSIKQVLFREYSGWLATVIGFAFVHWLRLMHDHQYDIQAATSHCFSQLKWVLITAFVTILVLRTAKKMAR
jgi:protein-S-isoprenylcysteine O-methyltransferase Ste14